MSRKRHHIIDDESLRSLYNANVDSLVAFLSYYTRNRLVIEDVVQEVFVELWEGRETLELRNIEGYIYRAARNKMLNHLRDSSTRKRLLSEWAEEEATVKEASECFDMERFKKVYQSALETLSPRCREVFLQSREQKMTYREIAEFNDISVKTVENHISTALKRIREYVLPLYDSSTGLSFLAFFLLIFELF